MNKIITSQFRRVGVETAIENPSPRVLALMKGISIFPPTIFPQNRWSFHHSEIGNTDEMQKLFTNLDACE